MITGIGLITPLGSSTEETWNGLLAGRSGIDRIHSYESSCLHTQIAGEADDYDPAKFITNRRSLRMMTRNDTLAVSGAAVAMRDSGLTLSDSDGAAAGLFVGSNKEISNPMHLLEGTLVARNPDGSVDYRKLGEQAKSAFYPLFFVEGLQAASIFYVSQAFDLKGANTYFAGTGESGAVAIGRAYRAVRRGEAEMAVAGGFDDASSWWNMSKFDTLGILTRQNDLGAAACRPYDRDRDGTVLGEGSAMVIVEPYDAAVQRGARIYAEITGFGSSYDAYKLVTPHPEGRGLVHAMQSALREAGTTSDAIGYIATHGSGTKLGDASEARALQTVFTNGSGVCASSVKAATGHLMGGAGALNVAVAALALHHQIVPPTLNLEHPDPECSFNWIRNESREVQIDQALALARGLEGQNVALALRTVR